jgi:hypothetical protein
VHVGAGPAGFSTGAGPVTLWTGGRRRRHRSTTTSVAAYEREVRRTERAQDIAAVAEVNRQLFSLLELHTESFPLATPPQAEGEPVDADAIIKEHVDASLHGTSPFKRSERRVAREHALAEAKVAITKLEHEREQQRADRQQELDEAWMRLQGNEPETVLEALEAAFEDNEFPAAPLDCGGEDLCLLVTLPALHAVVPERKVGQTPSGKLTIVKRTKTEQNVLYLGMMASAVIATCKESFAVAPGAQQATVLVARKDDLAQTIAPLALFSLDRATISDAGSGDSAAAIELLDRAPVVINPRGQAHELGPLEASAVPGLPEVLAHIAGGLNFQAVGEPHPTSDDDRPSSLGDAAAMLTRALESSAPHAVDTDTPFLGSIGQDMSFTAYQNARRELQDEYAAAATPDAKFEAVCMISWLHQRQVECMDEALSRAQELPVAEQGRLKAYVQGWTADAEQTTIPLMEAQNHLLEQLGRTRCEQIIDERATPRLETVTQQLRENLETRQAELRAAEGIKICPDCAEEIKSEARVCRFCGLRFDAPPESA